MDNAVEVTAVMKVRSAWPFPLPFGTVSSRTQAVGNGREGPGMCIGTGYEARSSPWPCCVTLGVAGP